MNMNVLAVGDLHGRDCWKKINPEEHDRIVFTGDYADSFDIFPEKILENLNSVIEFKKQFPGKVTLLLGNHDIQYAEYPHYRCSGFDRFFQPDYTRLFTENKELFQVGAQFGGYLFTHAGLSNSFARNSLHNHYSSIINKEIDVADLLNQIHQSQDQPLLHAISIYRGGAAAFGGITWADYRETVVDLLPGYDQVVGHAPQTKITKVEGDNSSITYIDVLGTKEEFLVLKI